MKVNNKFTMNCGVICNSMPFIISLCTVSTGQFGIVYSGWLLDAPHNGKRTTQIAIKTVRGKNNIAPDTVSQFCFFVVKC